MGKDLQYLKRQALLLERILSRVDESTGVFIIDSVEQFIRSNKPIQSEDKPLLQWVDEKINDCTNSLKEYQYSEYIGNRNYDLISMKKATLAEVKQKIESL